MNPSEQGRVAKLEEFNIFATGAEPAFDRLARLARYVVGRPMSWVCFHDADKQWIKAQDGAALPVELARERTLCRKVVDTAAPRQVFDLREETDPAAALAMKEFAVRSYAGVPIMVDGVAIGAIGAFDFEPKRVDRERERMLSDIADLAVTEIRLRKLESDKREASAGGVGRGYLGGQSELFLTLTRDHLRVLQAMPDAVIAVNRAGEIIFLNPAAERMLGRPGGSLVGRPFDEIRSRPKGEDDRCPIRHTMADGTERIIRHQSLLRADGKAFPVEIVSSPIRLGTSVVGTMVICRDASEVQDHQGVALRRALKEIARLKQQIARAATAAEAVALPPAGKGAPQLPSRVPLDKQMAELASQLNAAEIEQITRAMALAGNVIEGPLGAAAMLGIDPQTLRRKLAAAEAAKQPAKRVSRVERWAG